MGSALITGTSRGLGAYFARRLVADGWAVTGVGRMPRGSFDEPPGADYIEADLAAPDAVDVIVSRLDGPPSLVVHNAVLYPPRERDAETDALFRVNAIAPYELSLRLLESSGRDHEATHVFINSEAIYGVSKESGLYAASKAALRVLTSTVAAACAGTRSSAVTLLFGPLADQQKLEEIRRVATQRGLAEEDVLRTFLTRSNPNLVIDSFIDYEPCYASLRFVAGLGPVANGMLCRLDGGSAGSLV